MDARFDTSRDPRFKKLSIKKRKVALDDRFKSILDDSSFQTNIDPRTGKSTRKKDALHELHQLYYKKKQEDVDSDSSSVQSTRTNNSKLLELDSNLLSNKETSITETESDESSVCNEDDDRFSWHEESDSSDDEDDTTTLETELQKDSIWDRVELNIPMGDETERIAVLGCDWDIINAQDLFILFSSFLTNIGKIKRLAIYLSDFGKERLDYEAMHGPKLDIIEMKETHEAAESQTVMDNDNNVNDETVTEALRKHNKERSRYYYAVLECDTVPTASYLYKELEGVDCEFALDGFDLRFIPSTTPEFTDTFPRPPTSEATQRSIIGYKPPESFVSALRHTKVRCTWDETPAIRSKILRKRFTADDMAELDLKDYLASNSGSDNDEDHPETITIDSIELPPTLVRQPTKSSDIRTPDSIAEYRSLLLGSSSGVKDGTSKKETKKSSMLDDPMDGDIEITCTIDDQQNNNDFTATEMTATKQAGLTPWEIYLEQKKHKKKAKKDELKEKHRMKQAEDTIQVNSIQSKIKNKTTNFPLITSEYGNEQSSLKNKEQDALELKVLGINRDGTIESDDETDYTIQTKKHKRNKKKYNKDDKLSTLEANVEVTFDDDRFKEMFTNPTLAVDTTHPQFKTSKAYKQFFADKIKRRRKYEIN